MTPPATATAFPKSLPLPPSPAPAPAAAENKPAETAPSIVANPLLQKLKPSGKSPSHPLTAQPPKSVASVPPVSAADAKRAEKLLKDGIDLAKKNKLEPAFKAFQKAYKLDPNNERTARSVAKVLNLAGQPLEALMVCGEFLARFPGSQVVRAMRAAIGEAILPEMQRMLSSAPKEKQAKIAQTAQEVLWMTLTDQAILTKSEAPKLREELQALESGLGQAHGKPTPTKLGALAQLQAQAENLFTLANLPFLPPQEAEAIQKELRSLGIATLATAARFAAADSDPEVRSQAKLFEAYQAMAEGKNDAALAAFETVRSEGFKQLGGGDAAKGEALLREKFAKALKASQEKKPEDAKKALEGLPTALLTAHDFLESAESQKLVPANLGILKAWEERVDKEHTAKSADANGFFGKIGFAWDTLWGNPTNLDLIAKDSAAEKELIGKVRERLQKGESKTILEALQALAETGPEGVKARAKLVHEQVKAGQFDSGPILVGRLIRYASTAKPEDKVGAEILDEASKPSDQISNESSATLYGVVGLLSRNPDQFKRAGESYAKQVEKIEKAKKPS
jgi:hypothetical protein